MAVVIRQEAAGDQDSVFALNCAAFETDAEAQLVDALRKDARPLISLVAEQDGKVIGHILFSPAQLRGHEEIQIMGLAPMAVLPANQKAGIGTKLVRTGLKACKEQGARAAIVLGHPDYYPKFGFRPASTCGIDSEYEVPDDVFMAIEIYPGALEHLSGRVYYHELFSSLG